MNAADVPILIGGHAVWPTEILKADDGIGNNSVTTLPAGSDDRAHPGGAVHLLGIRQAHHDGTDELPNAADQAGCNAGRGRAEQVT